MRPCPGLWKGVPEELHQRLKEQAERRRMNSEAISILEEARMPMRHSAEEATARAEALNRHIGQTSDPKLIEAGKREGRA